MERLLRYDQKGVEIGVKLQRKKLTNPNMSVVILAVACNTDKLPTFSQKSKPTLCKKNKSF